MTIYNLANREQCAWCAPGTSTLPLTAFPPYRLSTFRLWDVAFWAYLEPASGLYQWAKMDGTIAVAQQHGVKDFIFTMGQPYTWASTNPTDPCPTGEGPGTCSPPVMSAYDEFATHVVQRYCGKVEYYEPWNEPNNPASWDGTNAQLLAMAHDMYQIAKSPANCGCTNGKCSPGGGVNPNKVLLPPISNTDAQGIAWLTSYLAAAGTPYPYADIATYHGYLWNGYQPEQAVTNVTNLKTVLAKYGMGSLPLWNTETSWGTNTNYTLQQQAAWLMRTHVIEAALGISRLVWYAYDACGWGTLEVPLSAATPCVYSQGAPAQLTPGGMAYIETEDWLIGATLPQCQEYQNGLWACELKRPGYDSWMLWSSQGTTIPVTAPVSLGLTLYRDWQGQVTQLTTPLAVGPTPVLLESRDF
jgi:hypothetical protein